MRLILFFITYLFISFSGICQVTFTFNGYTAGKTATANSYTYTNTQNSTTMSAYITTTGTPGWFNLTGGNSPNYAAYAPGSCSSTTGLFLATDRPNTTADVLVTMNFSPAVCGPVSFGIYDINGADNSFSDYVTINAWDATGTQIQMATYMINTNGATSCNGGSYGTYIKTSGKSLVVIGCSYNSCLWDNITIPSATASMISKITIDYASGAKDWSGNSISDPDLQYIILGNVTAYAPTLTVAGICPAGTLKATETGFPANPTYAWTADAAVFGAGPSTTTNTAAGTTSTVSYVTSSTSNVFSVTATSASGCAVTTTTTMANDFCILLSAEVSSFTGKCISSNKLFNWQTSSEINNAFFTLEKSRDGQIFETVAKIDGNGNSTREINYNHSYEEKDADYKYYRLIQTDFNGKSKTLKLMYLNCIDALGNLKLYPNPASSEVKVEFESSENANFAINITDILGRVLKSIQYSANQGLNEALVDIQDLPPGSYHVTVTSDTGSRPQILKFIKSID